MPHIFAPVILREYDIRGVVDENLTKADARAVGLSFAAVLKRSGGSTCAVGWDGRLHSPELALALEDGLRAAGINVHRVGLGATPMLYFAVHHLGTDGGIQVTGSHNPPEYNGFKMTIKGAPFYGAAIQELAGIAAAGVAQPGGGELVVHDVREDYVKALLVGLRLGKRTLKVAWDVGNGATGEVVEMLAGRLPGQHVLLNTTIDGTFPAHHPDPTVAKNLEQIIASVRDERCALGLAFDGDGDRLGVVDETGEILWGDQLLQLYAEPVLEEHPGSTIIADVKASGALFQRVADLGGVPLMWKTGHSLIKAKMKETKAPLAGEMSGHLFFADRYYGFDDALYAGLRLLEILSNRPESLSTLRRALPVAVNTPEIRLPCAEAEKFQVIERLRPLLKQAGESFSDVDGVRVTTPDGWWLLRASNTQAVLVARCEAADAAGLERVQIHMRQYTRQVVPA
jgi:phosphomannomutase